LEYPFASRNSKSPINSQVHSPPICNANRQSSSDQQPPGRPLNPKTTPP
jgi:hypothetical protein